MKQILLTIMFSAIMPFASAAECAADWIELRDQVKTLRAELARQGAYAFVTNRATTPPVAPHIHSQCWVDWLPKTNVEQIAYEQEKRDFGLDFFVAFEGLALPNIPLEDVDAQERHADMMLTIAEWLKTANGYGNQILKKWCEGIALSAMGSMTVNSKCDTNRVLKLLVRVEGVRENVERRVLILNEESPHTYKMPKCGTYNEVAKNLERQWHRHQVKTWEYFDKKDGCRNFTFDRAKNDLPEYAFYVPDHKDKEWDSIRTWWGMREHEIVCVYGQTTKMPDEILQILRYRANIGDIPKPTEEETNDLNLGFRYCSRLDDIWRKHTKGKEFHFLGASAVVKIYGHTFVDWITRALQLQREAERRDKLRKEGRERDGTD